MEEDLKELEKSFILDTDMKHENIKELIIRVQKHCQIDKTGSVRIDDKTAKKMTILDKVMLIMITRHLASELQKRLGSENTIKEEITSKELAEMLKEKQDVLNARLKDLKDKKQILSVAKGTYRVAPYAITPFLDSLGGDSNE